MGVDEVAFGDASGYVRRYQISQAISFPGKLSTKAPIAEDQADSASSDAETLGRKDIMTCCLAISSFPHWK